jgi:hypothetical protein
LVPTTLDKSSVRVCAGASEAFLQHPQTQLCPQAEEEQVEHEQRRQGLGVRLGVRPCNVQFVIDSSPFWWPVEYQPVHFNIPVFYS